MAVTDIYRLPWPEYPDPANASGDFQKLAEGVENHAFPALYQSGSGDAQWPAGMNPSGGFKLFSVPIPSTGVAGWVDIDADAILGCGKGNGVAGEFGIYINGQNARWVRFHNLFRSDTICVYNSVRWPNPNGSALMLEVVCMLDATSASAWVGSGNYGWQIYGKKVVG
jgi:hypothetical protein